LSDNPVLDGESNLGKHQAEKLPASTTQENTMKKMARKMSLNRETLRALDSSNLQKAVGEGAGVGGGAGSDTGSCASWPDHCPPCTQLAD
jgi:hypothetical protein